MKSSCEIEKELQSYSAIIYITLIPTISLQIMAGSLASARPAVKSMANYVEVLKLC
jgi:hypothetical protein